MSDQPQTSDATDYSKTLFLPQTDFPMRAGLPQREPEILKRWIWTTTPWTLPGNRAIGEDVYYPDVSPRDAQALREWNALGKAT